jgi:hypothetical protein
MLATRYNPITEVLRESFVQSPVDAVWYPAEAQPGRALVRVHVAESGHCVERRRRLTSPWMPIATVAAHDFDPAAFRAWRASARDFVA